MSLRSIQCLVSCLAILLAGSVSAHSAEIPLHQQIDSLIGVGKTQFEKTASAPADDATFLRRVTLDLTGTIPTSDEVRVFLADESTEKRTQLIDRLLASPEHARRMQYVFDTMLMERRPDKHVPAVEWRNYLRTSFLNNKPWDVLVREILSVDGTDKKTRPAVKFLLDRELKSELVTRDLGRLFLGRDLECAQCHNHPNVDDYLQRHYHGLSAFLNRSYLFKDPKTKKTSIGEKAEGLVSFTSVFTQEEGKTAPRMLDLPEIVDPKDAKADYKVKPAKNVRSVPVYSRRLQLANAMTHPTNIAFRQNIANRLWAMMMGRGFVEPLDMWHADNPPSHPKLLDLLTKELQKNGYNMRLILRELALSKTYQRSSQISAGAEIAKEIDFGVGQLKPLSPEQLAWSMMQATGLTVKTLKSLKAKQVKADPKNGAKKTEDALWQEEALHAALNKNVTAFITTFGFVGAQSSRFDASADQALFLRNGPLVQSWLVPSGDNLTARLKKLKTSSEIAEELYLSVFSRLPEKKETENVTAYLKDNQKQSQQALQQLVWAALSSDEFRFNH
ncbi:MAG: DUF1549 and DUF1553 domain-containing protein [Planctomycetes bacterium]|nr:DUF1549 and DUF1553 domain-containing protein [Planctomycetota bacterium]MCH9727068.1 DUF1549 and DUF1553 domain-containing protein [Planctomycetota bacterium]MCH9775011.1 DUF1549 and DUF1553 domain-containing protein [Planctomycetota bacterium]MCH9789292.1 DUF1549 and DUF1553 domain-containing protein [Planctomycetota bacterium]